MFMEHPHMDRNTVTCVCVCFSSVEQKRLRLAKERPGNERDFVVEQLYWLLYILSLVLGLVEAVGETALAAVVPVEVAGHEDAGAALVGRALATQAVDLTVLVDLTRGETVSLECL